MNAKDKITKINLLIENYGVLLTKKQLKIMQEKYYYDLSLQEIAENFKVSRSAIEDAIKSATNKLLDYENKLKLIKKKKEIFSKIKDEETIKILKKYL